MHEEIEDGLFGLSDAAVKVVRASGASTLGEVSVKSVRGAAGELKHSVKGPSGERGVTTEVQGELRLALAKLDTRR